MRDWKGSTSPREAAALARASASLTYTEADAGFDQNRPGEPLTLQADPWRRTVYLRWDSTISFINLKTFVIERSEISETDGFVEVGQTKGLTFIEADLDLGQDRTPKRYWWRVYARNKANVDSGYSNVATCEVSGLGYGDLADEAVGVAQLRDYSVRIDKLSADITELIAAAHQNFDALWDDLTGTQDGITVSEDEIVLAKQRLDTSEQSIAQLEVDVDTIKSTVATLGPEDVDYSQIIQNADNITSIVESGKLTDGQDTWLRSIVQQNAEYIESLVLTGTYDGAGGTLIRQGGDEWNALVGRVNTVEDNQQAVIDWGTAIRQTEATIEFLVKSVNDLTWDETEDKSAIVQHQEQIDLLVQKVDDQGSTFQAQLNIQADAITNRVRAVDADGNEVSQAFLQVGINPPTRLQQSDIDAIDNTHNKNLVLQYYTWTGTEYELNATNMTSTVRTTLTSILIAAGVKASQIILDADEVIVPRTILGKHLAFETVEAGNLKAGEIDAVIAQLGAIQTSHLDFTPATSDNVIGTINASGEGIRINTPRLDLTGILRVSSNDNPSDPAGETIIEGGKIDTSLINVTELFAQDIIVQSGGSIRAGGFSDDGAWNGLAAGFWLGASGILKAVSGSFRGVIEGARLLGEGLEIKDGSFESNMNSTDGILATYGGNNVFQVASDGALRLKGFDFLSVDKTLSLAGAGWTHSVLRSSGWSIAIAYFWVYGSNKNGDVRSPVSVQATSGDYEIIQLFHNGAVQLDLYVSGSELWLRLIDALDVGQTARIVGFVLIV